MADTKLELISGANVHGRGFGKILRLEGDPFVDVEAIGIGLVGLPGVAIEAGVEMDMPFDKSGNDQRAAEIVFGDTGGDVVFPPAKRRRCARSRRRYR